MPTDPTTDTRAGLAHELISARAAQRLARRAAATYPNLTSAMDDIAEEAADSIRWLTRAIHLLPMTEVPYV